MYVPVFQENQCENKYSIFKWADNLEICFLQKSVLFQNYNFQKWKNKKINFKTSINQPDNIYVFIVNALALVKTQSS